ncbi:MAG: NifB/NifX family molybdenum-iron cluster-binding protein [Syntrophaceae bacterium]
MKIVITTSGEGLEAPIDPRFGRAKHFMVFNTETGETATVDNSQNLNAPQGAGIQAAAAVSRLGATVLITGHCGPKAFQALAAAGIKIYTGATGSVSEAVAQFKAGKLKSADAADVEGHW